jgi:hypothetical protein
MRRDDAAEEAEGSRLGRPSLLCLVEVEGAGDSQLWSHRGIEPADA